MSTIVTENLKRASETASRSLRGVAAAWVSFNGTGTIAVRDSQNVSSLTDGGNGTYGISLSSAAADSNYCPTGLKQNASVNTDAGISDDIANRFAAAYRIVSLENAALTDSVNVNSALFGDLA